MIVCRSCGTDNPDGFRFCGSCGSPLAAPGPTDVRKTVTVVFCDLTGSTSLGERLDPEPLRAVVTRYFDEMKGVLERHHGSVEKFIGDAVMAIFGIPAVREDDALRAVRAAAEMRERLGTLNKELERDRGVTIEARIGVNTGEVMAGLGDPSRGESVVTGDAVNLAARLEQAAAPGRVLIGEATLRLVRDAVTVEPVEPLTMKGKSEPVRAYALVDVAGPGTTGVARHLDAPMVGRKAELESLGGALARAARERAAVLATVIGVPGVGKSRLIDEFASLHRDDVVVTHGRCLSYGDGITYWPVVEILTAVAGITDADGPDEIRSRIRRLLDGSVDGPIVVERLAEFLGLSGATAAPEETHWAIRKLFEALAVEQPLVVVFEDVHWAEPALLDLIEHVVTWTADAPIVLVCTARPELLEGRPDWGTTGPASVTMSLDPLTADESDELVANLTGSAALPDAASAVVRAAEGNPLFLEQLVQMLIDDGHLRRDGGAWVAVGDLASVPIPSTISGILEARLERLSPEERAVLERGSVEGRVFHWASVTALSGGVAPAEVGRDLLSLVRRGLIGPAEAVFGGSEAFRFRHALIRDAAYARLPKATRADLHERHARWVERIAGDRLAEFEDLVAYHLEQAVTLRAELGPLDDPGRALTAETARRLAMAGRRARARGDVPASMNLMDRALPLFEPLDPMRLEVVMRLGEAVREGGDPLRSKALFEEARATATVLGDHRIETRADVELAHLMTNLEPEGATAELDRAVTRAIPLLEELGDDEGLAIAWSSAGMIALIQGRADRMLTGFGRAALHAERAGDQGGLSEALGWLAGSAVIGQIGPADAIAMIREIRQRKPDDRKLEAIAAIQEATALGMLGRFEEARVLEREGRRILDDLGNAMWGGGTRYNSGWIELLAGDPAAAERELRAGIEVLGSMGELAYLSSEAAALSEALYLQGRFDEAEQMTDVAKDAGASDDLTTQWRWRAVRAKVLARRGELGPAVELAEDAAGLTEPSDFLDDRAEALADLAEVYELASRREDAARTLRRALEIAEGKGVVPFIERFSARLGEMDQPSGR